MNSGIHWDNTVDWSRSWIRVDCIWKIDENRSTKRSGQDDGIGQMRRDHCMCTRDDNRNNVERRDRSEVWNLIQWTWRRVRHLRTNSNERGPMIVSANLPRSSSSSKSIEVVGLVFVVVCVFVFTTCILISSRIDGWPMTFNTHWPVSYELFSYCCYRGMTQKAREQWNILFTIDGNKLTDW